MGGFYGSVQVRGDDREQVRVVLERLARRGTRFLIGPSLNGWIGVYPEGAGQDFEPARRLARSLRGELVAMLVHDDDVLAYEYHRDGKRIDQYDSIPDYFGEVSTRKKRALAGRPETFAHLAADREKFKAVVGRLASQAVEPDVFVSELLAEFAEALGIRNALTSYEYLKDDETGEIEGWDQFIHVPDPTDERAQRRAAEAEAVAAKQRLIREGVLLAEHGGAKGWDAPYPHFCPAPDGRGFLVAWSNHAVSPGDPPPLERHGPPWSDPPEPFPWTAGAHVYGVELSPSGRLLAVAHAAGDWKAALWDLAENRLVAETPQVRAVSCIGFTPHESAMFSVSSQGDEGRVVLTAIVGGGSTTIPIARAQQAAAHPSGSWLVVADDLGKLLVVDLADARIVRTRFVGGRKRPSELLLAITAQMQAAAAAVDVDALERRLRREQEKLLETLGEGPMPPGVSIDRIKQGFEDQIASIRNRSSTAAGRGFAPAPLECGNEKVFQVRFDPSGARLFLATMGGVRVYSWDDVLNSEDEPRPVMAVDAAAAAWQESDRGPVERHGYIYSLDHDSERDHLLFAGLDGRVRRLDLGSGRSDVVLEPPSRPCINRIALSRDQTALAVVSTAYPFDNGRNHRGPWLQFWNYEALR